MYACRSGTRPRKGPAFKLLACCYVVFCASAKGGSSSTKSPTQAQSNRSTKVCPRCSIKAGEQITCQGKLSHDYEYDNSTKRDPRNVADSAAAKKLKVSLDLWQLWTGWSDVDGQGQGSWTGSSMPVACPSFAACISFRLLLQ